MIHRSLLIAFAVILGMGLCMQETEPGIAVASQAYYTMHTAAFDAGTTLVTTYDSQSDCYVTYGYRFADDTVRQEVSDAVCRMYMSEGIEREYWNTFLRVISITYGTFPVNRSAAVCACPGGEGIRLSLRPGSNQNILLLWILTNGRSASRPKAEEYRAQSPVRLTDNPRREMDP